jgi:uncharacterized protein YkwD
VIRSALFAAVTLVTLAAQIPPPPDSVPLDVPKAHLYVEEDDEATMLADVNRLRADAGLRPLTSDPKLKRLARDYAMEMLILGYFGHQDPAGHTFGDRLHAIGYAFRTAGENIAFGPDENTAQSGLEHSPDHRHNILGRAFSRVGIGAVADSLYGIVFVQDFVGD